MDDLHGTHIKGYQLIERIGSGGFGAVYRAKQSTIGREVAVKIILPGFANNPDFIRRFETEAYLVARLEHPHITPLHDYWRDPQGAYLVMRYLRGGSVRDALADGPYELEALSYLLDQIASALDFAHRGGVIHRDIKPGNILLDEDANAYLADFGIAKDLSRVQDGLTAKDALVGSLDYISPEQARSEPVTPRTDIYSLGVTLYEMITGEHPFKEVSSAERLYKHINDLLPEISGLPDGLQDTINKIIQQATAKDPAQRYPDVLALAVAFREGVGRGTTNGVSSVVEQLTLREQEILSLIARGMSNREVADHLVITIGTVKWHLNQLYKKLGVRGRVQAIVRARELDLIVTGDSRVVPQIVGSEASRSVLLPEPENPYKGLHAFQMADAPDFFGREALVEKLVADMQAKTPNQRFLAVVGPSGSGKSSLVRAGLIPALWRGALPGSEKWFVVDMIPGTHPLDKLEVALMRVAANQANNLHEQLARDARGLLRVADLILPGDDSELLVVVDQFEEVFTLVEDEASRQHFLDLIGEVVSDPHSRVRVVVTLRADYYDRPLNYPAFGELVRSRLETVLPLSAQGLERAVRGPAERVGVTFEQGLVEQIVSEMTYQAGALPLLQYALTELFDRRSGRLLTREAYQAIGGAVGALANRADDIYTGLSEPGQGLAEQMFMRLVTLGEGAEDTRRRIPQAELLDLSADRDLMEEIIEQFADFRLLSLDHDPETRQPTVEVAHEAILRDWERLRAWINAARDDLRLHGQLTGLVSDWQSAGQDPSYLLHGARLVQFESWAAETSLVLTPREKGYIAASIQARAARDTAERSRQERETAQERRSRRLLRTLVAVLAVMFIGAVAFSLFALDRENRAEAALRVAEREAAVNRSLVLANEALDTRQRGQSDLALLIALESVKIDDPPQNAIRALSEITRSIGSRAMLHGHVHSVHELALSADNRLLASGSCATLVEAVCQRGEVILWDAATYAERLRLDVQEAGWITGLAFSPDSTYMATSSESGAVWLWDAATGAPIRRMESGPEVVYALSYHPTAHHIAIAGGDGRIYLWDAEAGEVLQTFEGHEGAVHAVAFDATGEQMLSGSADTLVHLWDVATGEILQTYQPPTPVASPVQHVGFDAANDWVVAASTERNVWRKDDAEHIYTSGNTLRTHGLAIADDGRTYEGVGRFVREEHPNQGGKTITSRLLYDHNTIMRSVVLSVDNRLLATGDDAGVVRLWNPNAQRAQRLNVDVGWASRLKLSHDETLLLVGNLSNTIGQVQIFDVSTGALLHTLTHDFPIAWAMSLHPDGRRVAIASINFFQNDVDSDLKLWDIDTGELLQTYEGLNVRISSISFSPDGRYLISGAQSFAGMGELLLWDVETGELLLRFNQTGDIGQALFTPDGQHIVTSAYFGRYVGVWDVNTGELLRRRDFDTHVEFSQLNPTGDALLVGLEDGRLLEVDIQTLETRRSFDGHTGTVWDIVFSGDGDLMASGQPDGIAILWDYTTGRELDRITHEGGFQTNLAFGPDDKTLFTSAYNTDVIEWYISNQTLDDLLAWTQANRYIRELTCTERETYRIEPYCQD